MSDDNPTVVLTAVLSEVDAVDIVDTLQDGGVQATQVGGLTSGMRIETMGIVKVLIHERDVDKAKELLAIHEQEIKEIDWDTVDVGELEV